MGLTFIWYPTFPSFTNSPGYTRQSPWNQMFCSLRLFHQNYYLDTHTYFYCWRDSKLPSHAKGRGFNQCWCWWSAGPAVKTYTRCTMLWIAGSTLGHICPQVKTHAITKLKTGNICNVRHTTKDIKYNSDLHLRTKTTSASCLQMDLFLQIWIQLLPVFLAVMYRVTGAPPVKDKSLLENTKTQKSWIKLEM